MSLSHLDSVFALFVDAIQGKFETIEVPSVNATETFNGGLIIVYIILIIPWTA